VGVVASPKNKKKEEKDPRMRKDEADTEGAVLSLKLHANSLQEPSQSQTK
jgi:hypothetical protein